MHHILLSWPQYYKATARTVRAKREHHGPVRLLSCVLEVDMRHALALIVNIIHIIYKYQILICIIKYQISNIKYTQSNIYNLLSISQLWWASLCLSILLAMCGVDATTDRTYFICHMYRLYNTYRAPWSLYIIYMFYMCGTHAASFVKGLSQWC